MATQSSILAWKTLWTDKPGGNSSWGHKESDMTERLSLSHVIIQIFVLMAPIFIV